jgi:hypothetical protein
MLKMAVLGPMPSARAPMTDSENAGAFFSIRTDTLRSDHRPVMSVRGGKPVANRIQLDLGQFASREVPRYVRLRDKRVPKLNRIGAACRGK